MNRNRVVCAGLIVCATFAAYSNHFGNGFQFDDISAIPRNPAIQQTSTIWRAFVDPSLFSSLPQQRSYRPVVTASLALDYRLAGGYDVFYFHLSTFFWYCVQLFLMFLLFERLMNLAARHPSNSWTALVATVLFALHPVCAETVNYIIQRADLYNALGCVASLWLFAAYPAQRRFGWYLAPAVLAMLAKPPALIFPLLLLLYLWLFELPPGEWRAAVRWLWPSLAVTSAAAVLLARMQPSTWSAGMYSAGLYRIAQPFVAMHYFVSFFVPAGLNVDRGWQYLDPLSRGAVAGYVFVLALLAAAVVTARIQGAKPISFGLWWFLIVLLPTSLRPLGEITNDHRMFFPFVGLALAVVWSLRLALFQLTAGLTRRRFLVRASVGFLAALALAAGAATRVRNRVWLDPESLWRDSLDKNPLNPRALYNYADQFRAQGDFERAVEYWDRAAAIDPYFPDCLHSLYLASLQLHRDDLSERYLKRAVALYKNSAGAYLEYADWLTAKGRLQEVPALLHRARELDPASHDYRRVRAGFLTARNAADRSRVFRALDTDHDGRLSAGELFAAPQSLASLDRNGDGMLSAGECGATPEMMRSDPLLRALDANHDGVISASEIRNAEGELQTLDRDGDGALAMPELAPAYLSSVALRVFRQLDGNRQGRIALSSAAGAPFRGLLADADVAGDGAVTLEELTSEIFYRADLNRDGFVTLPEMNALIRSGLLGTVQEVR